MVGISAKTSYGKYQQGAWQVHSTVLCNTLQNSTKLGSATHTLQRSREKALTE